MPHERYFDQEKTECVLWKHEANDLLIFKEYFVRGLIRYLSVDQVSIGGTKIIAHERHINTEMVMDAPN